ncbi:hypothetical protein EXE57_00720 [Nocardioides euryhalodurans]|uniref:Tyr recombinase domain-containing protein n=1 Tax=Nocardioides euryhalodurans TaxID=2518370 RepID=A0A4P7GQW7_9ACTN|nr:hypothetical protein EXE57_00720 [Nocardioides euryhalodurans]
MSCASFHVISSVNAEKRKGPKSVDLPDIVEMLVATGMRIGELLALRWSDIELTPAARATAILRVLTPSSAPDVRIATIPIRRRVGARRAQSEP